MRRAKTKCSTFTSIENNFPQQQPINTRHILEKRVVVFNSSIEEHLCVTLNEMILRAKVLGSKREYA